MGNAAGQPSKTGVTDFVYDKNGNTLSRTDYDWVTYAGTAVETGSTIKRLTTMTYHVPVPQAAAITNDTNAYWQPHNPERFVHTIGSIGGLLSLVLHQCRGFIAGNLRHVDALIDGTFGLAALDRLAGVQLPPDAGYGELDAVGSPAASGSGAVGRRILGTVVIAGMTSATMIAIFVIPATFYVVEKVSGATKHVRPEAPAPATGD